MSIVVEDGSSISGANSYVSVASATEYLELKGITDWSSATTATKEASLIKSCLRMEQLPWRGVKALSTNSLCWPRRGLYDKEGYPVLSDEIPIAIRRGQIELTYRFFLGRDSMADIGSGDGYITSEQVDVIKVTYAQGYSANYRFPDVDAWFEPFVYSWFNVELLRA